MSLRNDDDEIFLRRMVSIFECEKKPSHARSHRFTAKAFPQEAEGLTSHPHRASETV